MVAVLLSLFLYFLSVNQPVKTVTLSDTPTVSFKIVAISEPTLSPIPLHGIGQVTRHVSGFVGTIVRVQGYMLASEKTYAIFSDETGGAIGVYDLPVAGLGVEGLNFRQKYILQGQLIYGGLKASNHNKYHLELSTPPQPTK